MSMTIPFEVSKIEIVARLAEHLIPLAQHAASAGILIQDFERGLFGGILAVGGKQPDSPYDPDGYIKSIKEKVPNVDEVILRYIAESAETLRKNCLLSSSIALGCASEKALLLVLEAYKDALNPADQTAFIKSNQKIHSIKKRHQDFKCRYRGNIHNR